jgi:hypothetical protein
MTQPDKKCPGKIFVPINEIKIPTFLSRILCINHMHMLFHF